MHILIRDDDVNVYTNVQLFKQLHQNFIKDNLTHTVAVVMKDLWQNHALFWYLATATNLEVGLHGWEHKDYSQLTYTECYTDLMKSLKYWEDNSNRMIYGAKKINTFFAPWNRRSDNIIRACQDAKLNFCDVRKGRWGKFDVRSFHWWNVIDDKFSYENIVGPLR